MKLNVEFDFAHGTSEFNPWKFMKTCQSRGVCIILFRIAFLDDSRKMLRRHVFRWWQWLAYSQLSDGEVLIEFQNDL